MAHEFDPGYRGTFARLCKSYPGPDVYPPKDFRVEWGPISTAAASTARPGS